MTTLRTRDEYDRLAQAAAEQLRQEIRLRDKPPAQAAEVGGTAPLRRILEMKNDLVAQSWLRQETLRLRACFRQ